MPCEWRDIPGWEGWYQASSEGKIKRVRAGKRTYVGRVLSPGIGNRGYRIVRLWQAGQSAPRLVHAIVALTFLGPCPDNCEVNHKDGNKTNNHSSNLEYTTHRGNMEHAHKTLGLAKRKPPAFGENNPTAKLTPADIVEIRELYQPGVYGYWKLAARFGISRSQIARIVKCESWSHV